jgi:glucokinase
MNEFFVGLDIGGSKLAAAVGTADGKLVGITTTPTPQRLRPQEVVTSLLDLANLAVRKANAIWKEVKAVGISFGGPVNFQQGFTIACHHLPGWSNVPLVKVVKNKLQLPTVMDNDANVSALGEARLGAGKGAADFAYLTVSTGIGAGLILDGKIYRGTGSLAGEVGHTLLRPGGPLCTCGRNGCLEALASGWAIARSAKEALAISQEQSLLHAVAEKELDARAVANAAGLGDALALKVMAEAADALGQGIATIINALNLPLVVVGGGVTKSGEILFLPLREAVKRYAVPEASETVKIMPAELKDNSPLVGAILLASDLVHENSAKQV